MYIVFILQCKNPKTTTKLSERSVIIIVFNGQVHAYTVTVFYHSLYMNGYQKKTLLCQRQIQNPKLSSAIACIVFYVYLLYICSGCKYTNTFAVTSFKKCGFKTSSHPTSLYFNIFETFSLKKK